MRLPRKLKKALFYGPWHENTRLISHYQHIFDPYLHPQISFYRKYCLLYIAYDILQDNPGKTIEELSSLYGYVGENMVKVWNDEKFKLRHLYR